MTTTTTCVHVWRLPSPDDPVAVVDGVSVDHCARNCGETRIHLHRYVVPEWHRQDAARAARKEAMAKRNARGN